MDTVSFFCNILTHKEQNIQRRIIFTAESKDLLNIGGRKQTGTMIAAQRMLQRMFLPIDHGLCRILLQQSSCFLVDGLYLITLHLSKRPARKIQQAFQRNIPAALDLLWWNIQ